MFGHFTTLWMKGLKGQHYHYFGVAQYSKSSKIIKVFSDFRKKLIPGTLGYALIHVMVTAYNSKLDLRMSCKPL